MYLCKKLTKHSYPEIGRAFGGKHHTTVIHSCEKIKSLSLADAVFQKRCSIYRKVFKSKLLIYTRELATVSLSKPSKTSHLAEFHKLFGSGAVKE